MNNETKGSKFTSIVLVVTLILVVAIAVLAIYPTTQESVEKKDYEYLRIIYAKEKLDTGEWNYEFIAQNLQRRNENPVYEPHQSPRIDVIRKTKIHNPQQEILIAITRKGQTIKQSNIKGFTDNTGHLELITINNEIQIKIEGYSCKSIQNWEYGEVLFCDKPIK